ncbi:MAG: hypothetical protein LBQ12_11910 [Deltaproteobacteria bacterium]|nr:hypothetical protein [Deltaproteobacteria bacterium]
MGARLEKERRWVEVDTLLRDTHGAAHGWDGMRALARLVFGPEDSRVWAFQARSASELADFALRPGGDWGLVREHRLKAAASLAAGALEGSSSSEAATTAAAGSAGRGGGAGGNPDRSPLPVPAAERAFAEAVLGRILSVIPSAGRNGGPRGAACLADVCTRTATLACRGRSWPGAKILTGRPKSSAPRS